MSAKEATDFSGSRRRSSGPKAGSVWESRMKLHEFAGGIKVFDKSNSSDDEDTRQTTIDSPVNDNNSQADEMENKKIRNVKLKQSPTAASGKRKTWNKSDNSESSPLQIVRQRSELVKNLDKDLSFSPDGIKKISPLKKSRSVSSPRKSINAKVKSDCNEVVSDRSLKPNAVAEDFKNCDEPNKESDSNEALRSDEECKELVLFEEKAVPINDAQIKNKSDDDDAIEAEKKSVDVKEINLQEQKPKKILFHKNEKPVPVSPVMKKTETLNHGQRIHPSPVKIKPASEDHIHGTPRKTSKLKSFVDLIMWRDVSKSAFIFGMGTFAIISSSYTKDLNISFISVASYLGLVYLAAIFLFRSLINRRSLNVDNNMEQDCVIGEEEAIWVIKLFLPYLNEFLLKLRALFSGDPATTMKLSVLLFILARCGSSITIWKMAKIGFIGVFTVPKICSSYSSQLTAYGTFWIRRFRDAWDSCSHKKAVGFAIFTLVWNLSSVLARIWAVFVLFVAFKYYQHSSIRS